MAEEERSEAVNSPQILSADRVDANKVAKDSLVLQMAGKIDTRNAMEYTFASTNEESFLHSLTRKPTGAFIQSQSKAATIKFNTDKWTERRAYATSSVAGNKVTLVFY